MYVCICNAITERAVRECARNGACSVEQLTAELGVAAGCGRCRDCASDVLRDVHAERADYLRLVPERILPPPLRRPA